MLLGTIQDIVRSQVNASMPLSLIDGLILTPPPALTIQVGSSNLIIDADQVLISQSLLPRQENIEMVKQEFKTSENGTYQPIWLRGQMDFTSELDVGEIVLMLRFDGGQKYYIIDRGVSYGSDS